MNLDIEGAARSLSNDFAFERRMWRERPNERDKRFGETIERVAQQLAVPKPKTQSEEDLDAVLDRAAGEIVLPGRDSITPGTAAKYGLDFLGLLDRPLRAEGGAVRALREGKPHEVLPEIKKGFAGRGEYDLADALDMPEGTPEDDWYPWLTKEGARLGVNMAGDPLNLAFGSGVATMPFRAGARAAELARMGKTANKVRDAGFAVREGVADIPLLGEKSFVRHGAEATGLSEIPARLAGTSVGKFAGGQLPRTLSEAEEAFVEMQRMASTRDLQELYDTTNRRLYELFEEQGYTGAAANQRLKELFHDIEAGGPYDPDTQTLISALQPLRDKQRELYEAWINARRARGEEIPDLNPDDLETYLPHLISNEYTERLKGSFRNKMGDPTPMHPAGLHDYTDPLTGEVLYTGRWDHPNTEVRRTKHEIVTDPDGAEEVIEEWEHVPTGRPVVKQRTTKANVEAAYPETGEAWMGKPDEALFTKAAQTKRKLAHENLFTRMSQMPIDGVPAMTPITDAPSHYKPLQIPGFKGMAAHPAVANRWHNLAKVADDPAKMRGLNKYAAQLEQYMTDDHLWREYSKRYNSLWKRTQLMAPGFFLANWISDSALMYINKVDPTRYLEGRRLRKGVGDSSIPGWTQEELRNGFIDRNLLGRKDLNLLGESLTPDQALDYVDKLTYRMMDAATRRGAKATERVMDTIGLGKQGRAIGEVAEFTDKQTQKALDRAGELLNKVFEKAGSNVEENMKAAVAIDYLKKNVRGVPTEADLDRAARFAKQTLFDYGDLSPFMEFLRDTSTPFASWYSNIFRKTAADLVSQPQRLHRIGMVQDTIFEPEDPETKEMMPAYIGKAAPTRSVADMPFGEDEQGNPLVFRTARFLGPGTIEEFNPFQPDRDAPLGLDFKPEDTLSQLGSTLAPIPKAMIEYGIPWLTMGSPHSMYFQKPIDPLYQQTGEHELARFPTPGFGRLPRLADYAQRTYLPGGRWTRIYQQMGDPDQTTTNKLLYLLSSQLYPYEEQIGRASKVWEHQDVMKGFQKALIRARARGDTEMAERVRQYIQDYIRNNPDLSVTLD